MLDDYYLPRSSIDITAGAGFGAEFSIGSNDTVAAYRMLSGEGHFRVTNPNNSASMQMISRYYHRQFGIGGLGIDISGVPNISVTSGVYEMDEDDRIYHDLN